MEKFTKRLWEANVKEAKRILDENAEDIREANYYISGETFTDNDVPFTLWDHLIAQAACDFSESDLTMREFIDSDKYISLLMRAEYKTYPERHEAIAQRIYGRLEIIQNVGKLLYERFESRLPMLATSIIYRHVFEQFKRDYCLTDYTFMMYEDYVIDHGSEKMFTLHRASRVTGAAVLPIPSAYVDWYPDNSATITVDTGNGGVLQLHGTVVDDKFDIAGHSVMNEAFLKKYRHVLDVFLENTGLKLVE